MTEAVEMNGKPAAAGLPVIEYAVTAASEEFQAAVAGGVVKAQERPILGSPITEITAPRYAPFSGWEERDSAWRGGNTNTAAEEQAA